MSKYTIRKRDISGNYAPDTFTASTFKDIKKELTRPGNPWLREWSVHTGNGCIFNADDWSLALGMVERDSDITLTLLRDCRGD